MKITTPHYYKDFRCIAGACTDTCCAGWDVDVDEASYKYYKKVKGNFGKRLKNVMVPSEDGGCTFTLKEGGRCPFLNDENLCDLFIELGEDKLCETCAEFPRFINDFGSVKEMGIAPSCKTAGELILGCKDKTVWVTDEDPNLSMQPNDIDPLTYIQLKAAREVAYEIAMDRTICIEDRLIIYIDFAKAIQKHLDAEEDEKIAGVVQKFKKREYRIARLEKILSQAKTDKNIANLKSFLVRFKGMEVINPDWNIYAKEALEFLDNLTDEKELREIFNQFNDYNKENEHEYEQLMMYYIFRYFLSGVFDYNVLIKAKNALVGIIVYKMLEVADWLKNDKSISFIRRVDLAHLYSRQFEHSYYNYEKYTDFFEHKRVYSVSGLENILANIRKEVI